MREHARYQNVSRNQHFEDNENRPYYDKVCSDQAMVSNQIQYPVEEVGEIVFIGRHGLLCHQNTHRELRPKKRAVRPSNQLYPLLDPYQLPTHRDIVPRVWDIRQAQE